MRGAAHGLLAKEPDLVAAFELPRRPDQASQRVARVEQRRRKAPPI